MIRAINIATAFLGGLFTGHAIAKFVMDGYTSYAVIAGAIGLGIWILGLFLVSFAILRKKHDHF